MQVGGIHTRTLPNLDDGTFNVDSIDDLVRVRTDPHLPWTRAVCVENTHNFCGGKILSESFMEKVRALTYFYYILILSQWPFDI